MDNSIKRITKDKSIPQKYILPKHIDRYYTELKDGLSEKSKKIYAKHYGINEEQLNRIDDFRRLGAIETYKAPHILIKEGLKEWRVCAYFVKEVCSFNSKVLGFHHNDEKMLKGLTCYLNSKLAT